jgi:DNA-binding NarL/FixJ family response regulator
MTGRAIRRAVDNGLSRREIARTLGVNAETVRKIVAERGR